MCAKKPPKIPPPCKRSPYGIVANVLDCDSVVSEFQLQSGYHVHFCTKIPQERYELPYLPSYGLNITAGVLLHGWLWY